MLFRKSKNGKKVLLNTKYDNKIEMLFNATLNNLENDKDAIAKRLQMEWEVLMKESVNSYMKVYIALWYSYYRDLADNINKSGWRSQIENRGYSNNNSIVKSSQEAVFKFLFVHGFSSRQVAISDATGIDKTGIETLEDTWIKKRHGLESSIKD